jgi:uncharacterized membrane protein
MATRAEMRRDRARTDELHAKQPVTTVAGPYGHPFHPILVTLPIGAWVTSLVLDIASRTAPNGGALSRGAAWLIGVGVIGALVAALFGLMDLLAIPRDTPARNVGLAHMTINLVVVACFVGSFAWRMARGSTVPTDWPLFVLSGIALALLAASGWLGGTLSYRYGVRVADEETQLRGYLHRGTPYELQHHDGHVHPN